MANLLTLTESDLDGVYEVNVQDFRANQFGEYLVSAQVVSWPAKEKPFIEPGRRWALVPIEAV